tara:strand:+ start:2024 stop:2527 length:504 start_codon:yes stop_codon:yes gene_type:complete
MKDRASVGLIAVIVVLALVVIGVALTSTIKVRPYNFFNKLSNNKIENMTVKNEKGQDRIRYAQYPNAKSINVKNEYLINSESSSEDAERVHQLPGGLYGPNEEKILTFGNVQTSLSEQCANTSSGYSGPGGYSCFTKEQLDLLTTRGGNQTCVKPCQAKINPCGNKK